MKPSPPGLVAAALAAVALSACGGSADPCAVAVGTERPTSDSTANIGADTTTLSCTGSDGSTTLACTGTATLTRHVCSDGFGFAVAAGNTTVLLRYQLLEDHWVWGAALASGTALSGASTISKLSADPQPAAGSDQAVAFSLHSTAGTFDGTVRTTW